MEKDNKVDKVKEALKKLEDGIKNTMESEKFKSFLKFQSKFHSYSFNNAMLIYLQRPDASQVAGFKTWEKLERHVLKGQKGIMILAPCKHMFEKLVEKIDPKTNKPVTDPKTKEVVKEKVSAQRLSFRAVYVFDVNQTEGKELPTICEELQGNSIKSENIIKAIKHICEIPIVEKNITDGSKGYYSRMENLIAVKQDMTLDQTAKTLIHEFAHSQLHNTDAAGLLDRATKEVQAESVAFIVADHYGVDTSEYSFEYLASWSSGKELKELKDSLNIIQKTSDAIINKMNDALGINKELQRDSQSVKEVNNNLNIKEQIIKTYSKEFPAIKFVTEKTANMIYNMVKDKPMSIKDIKALYKETGKRIEVNNNKDDIKEFKNLKGIVDDLKQAQLNLKKEQAHENTLQQHVNTKNMSMEL